ncbi:MAG: elongation factor G [Planctomycetaceae bacterium]|nr:elongation factor G [Planctomycetaceae bacterium]
MTKKYSPGEIRNLAVCGHGAAGKTTLVDQLLLKTGAITHPASVDHGTSICDFDEEEKHHKHSIEAKLVHFEHAGKLFNVADTPGYPDFIGQTICSFRGVDTAVIVINAYTGIGVNTRRCWEEAAREDLGRILVINKLDSENIDFPGLIASIKEFFGERCVLFNVPDGTGQHFTKVHNSLHPPQGETGVVDLHEAHQRLIEAVAELDDEVMNRYFEGTEPSDDEVERLVDEAEANESFTPIFCVSAKTGVGIPELLDGLVHYAISPLQVHHHAHQPADDTVVEIKPDPAGPLVAQVFKTRVDPFVQKLSFIRIFSGTVKKDDQVMTAESRKGIKFHQLCRVQAGQTVPIDEAGPGEIVAVTKIEDLHTGTVLGNWHFDPPHFPVPMVGLAVTPKNRGDEAKLAGALHKIAEEDPTLRIDHDPQTHELVMTGMSELHLQMIRERLKRRDKVEIEVHEPKIPYRETVQFEAEGSYRHKKQSGGRGQFGEVHIRVYPFPAGSDPEEFTANGRFPHVREFKHDKVHNFLWIDSIVGGSIPNNFLPAVEKGFKERLERGVLAGYQVQNVAVEVHFGKHHPVDSSEAAFKTAGSMAFRNVFLEAKPGLLEPIVKLHVTVPAAKLGDISADMAGRRGRVLGMDSAGGDLQTVEAEVPLAEVTSYARALSSITAGQGSYTMEFSHYDVVPGNIQKTIVDKAVLKEEEDEGQ